MQVQIWKKEDIRQMIEKDMNEDVQEHFGFLRQIPVFSILASKQLLFAPVKLWRMVPCNTRLFSNQICPLH